MSEIVTFLTTGIFSAIANTATVYGFAETKINSLAEKIKDNKDFAELVKTIKPYEMLDNFDFVYGYALLDYGLENDPNFYKLFFHENFRKEFRNHFVEISKINLHDFEETFFSFISPNLADEKYLNFHNIANHELLKFQAFFESALKVNGAPIEIATLKKVNEISHETAEINVITHKILQKIEGKKIGKNLTFLPPQTVELIGRDKEITELSNLLNKSDLGVLITGIGGIGKTELLKKFLKVTSPNFDHIAWVDYSNNLKESFINQFTLGEDLIDNNKSIAEKFHYLMKFLNNHNEHTLLIIDNIIDPNDEELDKINGLPIKKILTSRREIKGFKEFDLGSIDIEDCKKIFYGFYEGEPDDLALTEIIQLSRNHTLTIELLAKTAYNASLGISDLLKELKTHGFNLNEQISEKVDTTWNKEKEEKQLFNHLTKLFNLSGLDEEEKYILKNLSILPSHFIEISKIKEWLKLENNEKINSLKEKGWLKREGNSINLHNLIQEVVKNKLPPNFESSEQLVKSFLDIFVKKNRNFENNKFLDFASFVLKNIKEPKIELSLLSNSLFTTYHYLGDYKQSYFYIKIALDIFENIKPVYFPLKASLLSNLGTALQELGKYEEALKYKLDAINIYKSLEANSVIPLSELYSSIASTYSNTGILLQKMGKNIEALKYQSYALKIREEKLSDKSYELAASYGNLAMSYLDLLLFAEALPFQIKSLELLESQPEKNYNFLAPCYGNLGSIYGNLGRHHESIDFNLKSIETLKKLSLQHPKLAPGYGNLALAYLKLGNFEKALEIQNLANVFFNSFGENHPEQAHNYSNYSHIYHKKGNLEKAIDFQIRSLNLAEKTLGIHPFIIFGYEYLSNLYEEKEMLNEAIIKQEYAVNLSNQLKPENPKITALMIEKLQKLKQRL